MAETTPPTAVSAWDPATDPTRAWAELRQGARTGEQRACVAAATRQADRTWIALHNGSLGIGPAAATVPPRDATWHRLALSEHDVLHTSGAYGHLARIRPWACAAAEAVIAAWLNSPAPGERDPAGPGGGAAPATVAQSLGVGDAFTRINGDTQVSYLSTLLGRAQDAAVFGVPGHRVELVGAAGHHDTATVVRVVVDTPGGLALASQPLELTVLVDPDGPGVDAATATLGRVADIATGLFVAHTNAVWDAPPPIPAADRAITPAGRAFPELRRDQHPAAPASSPPPGPPIAPRGATSDNDTGRTR